MQPEQPIKYVINPSLKNPEGMSLDFNSNKYIMTKPKIIPTDRQVIENQLLVELNDKTKMAILVTRSDLDLLLDLFERAGNLSEKEQEYLDDLLILKKLNWEQ